jgi:hypothetical protein
MTREQALAYANDPNSPVADAIQIHDVGEEADERLQQGLHDLAARSVQPVPPITIRFCTMPEEAGR